MRRYSLRSYQRRQAKLEDSLSGKLEDIDEDVVLQTEKALTTQELLIITRDGKAYTITVNDIPATQRQSRGGAPGKFAAGVGTQRRRGGGHPDVADGRTAGSGHGAGNPPGQN